MGDEMLRAALIPVVASLGYWCVVKPLAWVITRGLNSIQRSFKL